MYGHFLRADVAPHSSLQLQPSDVFGSSSHNCVIWVNFLQKAVTFRFPSDGCAQPCVSSSAVAKRYPPKFHQMRLVLVMPAASVATELLLFLSFSLDSVSPLPVGIP